MKQYFLTFCKEMLGCFVVALILTGWPEISSAQSDSFSDNGVQLFAAASNANITPSPHVKNWVTGEPYGVIRDSIYVRSLVISDGVHKVVLLHWELVDVGESARDMVRERISKKLNIPQGNILINASHNHSAPWAPVYGKDNNRGRELYPWWVTRHMPEQDEDLYFKDWKEQLLNQSLVATEYANSQLQPVSMWLGRYDVSRFLRNRRPRPVESGVGSSGLPEGFNYGHKDWDPRVLSGDRTFGPMDRTMTVLSFRNDSGVNVSTIFHLACHAVSIYPFQDALSGDWPGATTRVLNQTLGGDNLFLQGAAGNINPWRRGEERVKEMAESLAQDISKAYKYSAHIHSDSLKTGIAVVGLPLTDYGQELTGLKNLDAEIQVVTIGTLALVTFPGEPMTELNLSTRAESPYPQTIVLGYSNGNGGHYCGMPGEKAYGGYEVSERANLGSDQAGLIMVKTAIGLLEEMNLENK